MIFEIFYFDLSGIYFNNEHFQKIFLIEVRLIITHFEISGNEDHEVNEEQQENISLILIVIIVFHSEISVNDNKDEHSKNI